MKRIVRELVHREFRRGMAQRLPHFLVSSERVPKGDLVYSNKPRIGLAHFVILEINPNWNSFALSLAWNDRSDALPRILGMNPSESPFDGQMRFLLPKLWDESSTQDPWHWKVETPPELGDAAAWLAQSPSDSVLLARADQLVDDALRQLETVGVPYFAAITQAHS